MFPSVAGDQPIARVRTPRRVRVAARGQATAVGLLALVPLTASGHYAANVVGGHTDRAPDLVAVGWLLLFSFLGVALVLAAATGLLPGWQRAGRGSIALLSVSAVLSTIDYWQLIDSPTGLALNAAGLALVVGATQSIYWAPRSPLTSIILRPSERVTEWLSGVLAAGGTLAFVLPHRSTIDGAPEDCAPLWIVVERDCLTPDITWWPLAVAAIVIGSCLLWVIHRPAPRTAPTDLAGSANRRYPTTHQPQARHHSTPER